MIDLIKDILDLSGLNVFIIALSGILCLVILCLPYFLFRRTQASSIKVTFITAWPVFLLLTIISTVILSTPLILLAAILGAGGDGTSGPENMPFLFFIMLWGICVVVLGLPIFGVSYVISYLICLAAYYFLNLTDKIFSGYKKLNENSYVLFSNNQNQKTDSNFLDEIDGCLETGSQDPKKEGEK